MGLDAPLCAANIYRHQRALVKGGSQSLKAISQRGGAKRLKNVLRIDHDFSLLAQFLVLRVHELLERECRLLPFLLAQSLTVLRLVCLIRLHISRLAFRHLEHKMLRTVMCRAHVAHLQSKSHPAEVNLTAKLGDRITTFVQASLHHLHGQSSSQVSERCASPHLSGPLLGLLPGQFIAFLQPQFLSHTLFHGTELLQRSGMDRGGLKYIGRPILPLQGIDAEFRQSKHALDEVGDVGETLYLSGGSDKWGRHDLQLVLLGQFSKLLWIRLQGSQEQSVDTPEVIEDQRLVELSRPGDGPRGCS